MKEKNIANSRSDRGSIQTCDPVKVKERSGFKKEGYKKTKLGWIPEDWEIKPISSMGKVITGSTPSTNDSSYYGDDYLFVSPGDMDGVKFVVETSKKLTKSGFDTGRLVKKGSTLFVAIGSTIGKTAIAGEDLITNQQINSIVAGEKNNDQFIFHQLTHQAKRIALLAGRQAVPIINKTSFSKVLIIRPPLPEQQKIAAILSTWDRAIAKQEQLINAKQEFKKGLMQLLLTGKKRFEGFEGEWKAKKLKDLGEVFTGGTPSSEVEDYWGGEITWYTPSEIRGAGKYIQKSRRKITLKGLKNSSATIFPKNTIVICTRATIGELAISKVEACTNQGFKSLNVNENNEVEFIYYKLKQSKTIFMRKASGSTFLELSTTDFRNLILKMPPLPEQQKIASVLSAADKEIGILQSELTRLRGQKRGLMQRLLTGEVRLNNL